jgi:uncharacterized protein YndB with AHSA1/START domain
MTTNTITFQRVLRCPADRIYRAFTTAAAFAKWLPPHGFAATVHHMEAKVGGTYRMSFTNLTTGHSHSFGGRYIELDAETGLAYTATFEDPNMPGEMTTRVRFAKVLCGTELKIEQSGVPAMIPVELCQLGWQESLALLALLVEPEIKQ